MEQIPSYDLLQAIDPTKIKVPISERFAKLTLSSNKKQQQKCDGAAVQNPYKIQKEKRDSVTRDISKQFVNEIQESKTHSLQNPLLGSESCEESDGQNSNEEDVLTADLTMEPLEVSTDAEENNAEQVDACVELLSQQIASLMVDEPNSVSLSSGSTGNISLVINDLVSSDSQRSSISDAEKIHIIHHIPINVKLAVNQETIPLNLNSSLSGDDLEKTYEMTEDEEENIMETKKVENNNEEEEEIVDAEDSDVEGQNIVITISDTTGSLHETEEEIMAISNLPSSTLTSENLSLPSLEADKAERVAAFLRDVSIEHRAMNEQGKLFVNDTVDRILDSKAINQLQTTLEKAKQIATADTESMTADGETEGSCKYSTEREKRLTALDDFDENKDVNEQNKSKPHAADLQKSQVTNDKHGKRLASDETIDNTVNTDFDNDYNTEKTPSPKTPKANDKTQCNNDFTFNEETPKVQATKVNRCSENSQRKTNLYTDNRNELSSEENSLSPENKKKFDPCRIANDDTIANSDMSDNTNPDTNLLQDFQTPKQVIKTARNKSLASINSTHKSQTDANQNHNSNSSPINYSSEEINSSVPEVSITISETDDEENVEQAKSSINNESLDNKLSNSFHREESTDDSEYEQKLSKIQMSMASINISAKINIKIHIPNNISSSENSEDEPHLPKDRKNKTQQPKQLTDQTAKTSDDEIALTTEHNNDSNEKNIQSNSSKNKQNSRKENSNNHTLDKDKKHSGKQFSYNNESNNQSIQFATPQRNWKHQGQQTKAPKERNALSAKKSTDSPIQIVEDQQFLTEAERLLNQLYGKSWQTPEVIRTLKGNSQSGDQKSNTSKSLQKKHEKDEKNNKKSVAEESVLNDFSTFRRNIVKTNLDSTRLDTPKSNMPRKIKISTEPRKGKKHLRETTDAKFKPQTERKPRPAPVDKDALNKRHANNNKWRQLIDNDSISEGDNASDDDDADQSWSKNASELDVNSSDSDFEISPKPKINRKNKNVTTNKGRYSEKSNYLSKMLHKSTEGDLLYLDLSQEEVTVQEEVLASPPANHDLTFASRLQDILKTCRHEDKAKLPASNKKSKRKLFTPNFGDDNYEIFKQAEDDGANSKEIDKENIKRDTVLEDKGNSPFDNLGRPKIFDFLNKPLEAVKTGQPIFQLTPSPKKKGTPSIATNSKITTKTPAKNNEATTFKTPVSVKSTKKQSTASKNLLLTSNFKYSFLKSLDVSVSKSLCHPDALFYRDNYRTKKEDLSKILYDIYNEKLFDNKLEVPLNWNKKLLNTAGRCLNKKKLGIRSSVVELSEKVLTSGDRLRCTLIHELCHAATWIFNGEGGHGNIWKEWARKANAVFPEIPKIGVCHQYDIEYKYTYKCTLCAAKSHAHSKSKKVENIRCSYCHGAIEIFLNKKDKDGNVIPTPVKEATGFAKFVKDNYKKFKSDDLKHADVMKLLSNEFASLKVTSNCNL